MKSHWAEALREAGIRREHRCRVQQRLAAVEYADEHGLSAAGRKFGLDRKTVREWRKRYAQQGVAGLAPRYPAERARKLVDPVLQAAIDHARVNLSYGATKTQLWLWRAHRLRISQHRIRYLVRSLELPGLRKQRKPPPRQLHLVERETPGDCVQIDVKFVRVRGRHYFQYTAIDDCSRFRVLRLFRYQNVRTSLEFLSIVRREMPFRIRQVQTNNGTEFSFRFKMACEEAELRHRYIRPRRPQQNGKVERSHRIDNEEFWNRHCFKSFEAAEAALRDWQSRYNRERISMALRGRTPTERLEDFQLAA